MARACACVRACVQDVMIRSQRMRGRKALWVPGTDHAGIATQVRRANGGSVGRARGHSGACLGSSPFSPAWTAPQCSALARSIEHLATRSGAAALTGLLRWLCRRPCTRRRPQSVVEKMLAKQGVTRQSLGREAFTDKVCAFGGESALGRRVEPSVRAPQRLPCGLWPELVPHLVPSRTRSGPLRISLTHAQVLSEAPHRVLHAWVLRGGGAGVGVEARVRRLHHQPAAAAGCQLRLGPGALHPGRGLVG